MGDDWLVRKRSGGKGLENGKVRKRWFKGPPTNLAWVPRGLNPTRNSLLSMWTRSREAATISSVSYVLLCAPSPMTLLSSLCMPLSEASSALGTPADGHCTKLEWGTKQGPPTAINDRASMCHSLRFAGYAQQRAWWVSGWAGGEGHFLYTGRMPVTGLIWSEPASKCLKCL